jgi:hypothetical protein
MNTNSSIPSGRRKWLWPIIAVVVLLVWTAYCEVNFARHFPYYLRAVPAFFLGAMVLLILNLLVRLEVGQWRGGWRWLVRRETRRLCGWTIVFVVSLLALLYSIELWQGKRAWAAVVREAKARGESLDYEALFPPEPADPQNFAKAPLFAEYFEPTYDPRAPHEARTKSPQLRELEQFPPYQVYRRMPARWLEGRKIELRDLPGLWKPYIQTTNPPTGRPVPANGAEFSNEAHVAGSPESITGPDQGKPSDDGQFMEVAEGVYAPIQPSEEQIAEALLVALEKYRPSLDEASKFSDRPACWFPRSRVNLIVPDRRPYEAMHGLMRLAEWRASAELVANRTDAAFEDVKFGLRLADHGRQATKFISTEPVSHHTAIVHALQPLWEGLTTRCWSIGQVTEIQSLLEKLDLLRDYADAVRADALTVAQFVESAIPTTARPTPAKELLVEAEDQRWLDLVRLVYPRGWSLQDQAAIHRFHLQTTSRYFDLNSRQIVGKWPGASEPTLFTTSDPFFHIGVCESVQYPFPEACRSFSFAQTAVDLATLACALERHRLGNGEFPSALDALVPKVVRKLPHDIVTGEPLKYRRTDGGGFVLYSVGLNMVDDGGKQRILWQGLHSGDWVWECPAPLGGTRP